MPTPPCRVPVDQHLVRTPLDLRAGASGVRWRREGDERGSHGEP